MICMISLDIPCSLLKAGVHSHLVGRYTRHCRASAYLRLPLTTAQSRPHGAKLYMKPYRSAQHERMQGYDHSSYLLPYIGPSYPCTGESMTAFFTHALQLMFIVHSWSWLHNGWAMLAVTIQGHPSGFSEYWN